MLIVDCLNLISSRVTSNCSENLPTILKFKGTAQSRIFWKFQWKVFNTTGLHIVQCPPLLWSILEKNRDQPFHIFSFPLRLFKLRSTGESRQTLFLSLWNIFNLSSSSAQFFCTINKLAKARKTRTSPITLGLKKFGLGKLWVKNVFSGKKKFFRSKTILGQKTFWVKIFFG